MSNSSDQKTTQAILALLTERRGPQRIHKLLSDLGLRGDSRKRIRRLLKALVAEGRVTAEGRGCYRLAQPTTEREGDLVCRGKGRFLVETGEGGTQTRIHPDDRMGALPGDRVRVAVTAVRRGGVPEGRVIEIVSRGAVPIVGIFQERPRTSVVLPDDPELCGPVIVSRSDAPGLRDGVVVAVVLNAVAPRSRLQGTIVQVLGEPGALSTEVARLVLRHSLREDFPEEVEREPSPEAEAGIKRVDLRSLPHVTIDPEDARDHDDAVYVERSGDGFRLLVSIADVSSFVVRDGPTDREALERGCSVYFPSRVFPMLPRRLSEENCSLSPGRDRLALTAELTVDRGGDVVRSRVFRSLIRSCASLNYSEVQRSLEGKASDRARPHEERLVTMAECARRMLERMSARGALDLDLPEAYVRLDAAGLPAEVRPAQRHFANRIIEVFMIAANEAVARIMEAAGAPAIYRVHPPPDADKVELFRSFAESLGAPAPFTAGVPSPGQMARYLESLQGSPLSGPLSHLLLRSLMQARYLETCEGHFGLASEAYLHFTSPIRRYPDLVVHRQLGPLLDRSGEAGVAAGDPVRVKRWPHDAQSVARIADRSSTAERRALEAERAALSLYQAAFMQGKVGEVFAGTVVFVTDFGMFVRVHPFGVEGLVHVARMRDDFYRFVSERMILEGRRTRRVCRVGTQVRVRVDSVQLSRGQIDLSIVEFAPEEGWHVDPSNA